MTIAAHPLVAGLRERYGQTKTQKTILMLSKPTCSPRGRRQLLPVTCSSVRFGSGSSRCIENDTSHENRLDVLLYCNVQRGEERLKPQTDHTPWTWRITPDECNLNATQLAPEVRRGAVWMRCTPERTSANPLECGLARPEPQYTR